MLIPVASAPLILFLEAPYIQPYQLGPVGSPFDLTGCVLKAEMRLTRPNGPGAALITFATPLIVANLGTFSVGCTVAQMAAAYLRATNAYEWDLYCQWPHVLNDAQLAYAEAPDWVDKVVDTSPVTVRQNVTVVP